MGDTMREAFEACMRTAYGWTSIFFKRFERHDMADDYVEPTTRDAWLAYQAAHEAGRQLGMSQADALWELAKTSEAVADPMSAKRAAFFMERFKREEKLLGPNEQAAVAFVIAMLEREAATPQPAAERVALSDEQVDALLKDWFEASGHVIEWAAPHYLDDLKQLIRAAHGIGTTEQEKEQR